jgi:hypothetical protein
MEAKKKRKKEKRKKKTLVPLCIALFVACNALLFFFLFFAIHSVGFVSGPGAVEYKRQCDRYPHTDRDPMTPLRIKTCKLKSNHHVGK